MQAGLYAIIGEHLTSRRDRFIFHSLSRDAFACRPVWPILRDVLIRTFDDARSFRTWILRHGDALTTLEITIFVPDSILLGVLSVLRNLRSLKITIKHSIEPFFLESMQHLTSLALTCTTLTMPSWSKMPPDLRDLHITCTSQLTVSDAFVHAFPKLTQLSITSPTIRARDFPRSLRDLSIEGAFHSEESIEALQNLTLLEKLKLSKCYLKYAPEELEHLTSLTHLDLSHNKISSYDENAASFDNTLESIKRLPRLMHLNLSYNAMDDTTFEEFADFATPCLKSLDVSCNYDEATTLPCEGTYLSTITHVRASCIPSPQFFERAVHLEEFTYKNDDVAVEPISLSSVSFRPKRVKLEAESIPISHIQSLLSLITRSSSAL